MPKCTKCNKNVCEATSYVGKNYKCINCLRKMRKSNRKKTGESPVFKRSYNTILEKFQNLDGSSNLPQYMSPPSYHSSQNLKQEEIYNGIVLTITFTKNEEVHDGYCSDPGTITTKTSTIVKKFPCPKKYIDDDGNLIEDKYIIAKRYLPTCEGCERGSGYCGCRTRYFIKDVTVSIDIKSYIKLNISIDKLKASINELKISIDK